MKFRNIASLGLIDVFLVSAAVSMLVIRVYLHLTGYPQIGGAHLHIAHMLWGGMLMLIALMIGMFYIGPGVTRIVAIVGGAGFGLFIDELGKFITRDNNYFYQPTIGIIYLIFVVVYIGSRVMVMRYHYRASDYKASAFRLAESALDGKLTEAESKELTSLLAQTGDEEFNKAITRFVAELAIVESSHPSWYRRLSYHLDGLYHRYFDLPELTKRIRWISAAGIIVLIVLQFLLVEFSDLIVDTHQTAASSSFFETGYSASSFLVDAIFIIAAVRMLHNRLAAFRLFYFGLLINVFVTQFFLFGYAQLYALPVLIANALLLAINGFILRHEGDGQRTI